MDPEIGYHMNASGTVSPLCPFPLSSGTSSVQRGSCCL